MPTISFFYASSNYVRFCQIKFFYLQELLQVFETLDHQSYMLGRYRESNKSGEEKDITQNLNLCNSKTTANLGDANHTLTEGIGKAKNVKIIAEEEEESDEDLSYLL